ncbi:PDZ domain-containing protein [Hymenobacter sp. BT175]|uniref:M61 family metallopeptidase n=1 Tax=Hymenobacter translucens TaxID=2886507 RepID=UPI001D0EDC8A|nr:PDZ domain-containing protein [Hymenobacter translucens]MCC2548135.1 PDZ domain-containing protein [Hymenobacter translucens]
MRNSAFAFLLSLLLPLVTLAQAPVQYLLRFPNALHHEAQITVVFPELPAGALSVRMARSSPGRYALHEFAKNVYAVQATDSKGKTLSISRPDPYGWDVAGHDGTVRFSYTLYADRIDGTYAGIDAQHAHLNIPATLAYARGLEQRPAAVRFELPTGWKVSTQLQPDVAGITWTAPHLQYLMDSPVSLGNHARRTWQQEGRTIEFDLLHDGTEAEFDQFAKQAQAVTREASAVFGELPAFDFGRYTFIANYLPQASSDGMEHRNSTSLTSSQPLRTGAMRNMGTVSHEFFHAWNVERIRPRDLEPFDFERANMSNSLWLAEGFTQYYGGLIMRRAGLLTDEQYSQSALSGLVNALLNSPGAKQYSPVEMSQQAPFVDAAASIDPGNRANTYLSYYEIGGANALALDLELRQNHKTTLDVFMQAMWLQHGKPQANFAPAAPYTLADVQRVLGQVAKDTAFAGTFFRRHLLGHQLPDFEKLLAPAGLLVRRTNAGKASLGPVQLTFADSTITLGSNTLVGTPLYVAGLDREDKILSLDGQKLRSRAELAELLGRHKPGDVIRVEYHSRTLPRTAQVTLYEDPSLEVVSYEKAGRPVTKKMQQFRTAWLGSKWKSK